MSITQKFLSKDTFVLETEHGIVAVGKTTVAYPRGCSEAKEIRKWCEENKFKSVTFSLLEFATILCSTVNFTRSV
jgi:hypothetical protein